MTAETLSGRTERFARRIVTLCLPMLENAILGQLARHLLRAGTAANANYVSAQRSRSQDEFAARLGHAFDDAAEAKGLIDVLGRVKGMTASDEIEALRTEAAELMTMLARAYRAAEERATGTPGDPEAGEPMTPNG